jgi:hypothetical protein
MRIALNDTVYASSTLQTPQEYIVLIVRVLYTAILVYMLIKCLSGKWIDLRTQTGHFSIFVLTLNIGCEILGFLMLYKEWATKLIGLLFALIEATVGLVFILGLLNVLKGFSDQSRFITIKRIKYIQILFCILHVICVCPHYYLFWFLETKRPDNYSVLIINYRLLQCFTAATIS